MPHLEIQHTDDGSATLFVPELDEHYHSVKGAYTESLHIYRGSAYNSGKESIPAKLRAGSKSQGPQVTLLLPIEQRCRKLRHTRPQEWLCQ